MRNDYPPLYDLEPRAAEASVNRPHVDVREELLKLGMSQVSATMVVPFVWFAPGTSDPFSPAIIMLVRGIQSHLRTLGYRSRGDGYVDRATDSALRLVAGPDWKAQPWIVVVGHALRARPRGQARQPMGFGSLGHYDESGYYGSLGVIDTSDWSVSAKGNCKGKNMATVMVFRSVQAQANRVLKQRGQPMLAVDGILGPKSMTAVGSIIGGSFNNCSELARQADIIARQIQDIADKMGTPAVATGSPVPKEKPSVKRDPVTGRDQVVYTPTAASLLPFDASPMTLAALGLGAVLIYTGMKQKPKRGGGKTRRRRRRR